MTRWRWTPELFMVRRNERLILLQTGSGSFSSPDSPRGDGTQNAWANPWRDDGDGNGGVAQVKDSRFCVPVTKIVGS